MAKQNNNLINYRNKHPRCRYCKYNEATYIPDYVLSPLDYICNCRVKGIRTYTSDQMIKREIGGWRCKCFEAIEHEI